MELVPASERAAKHPRGMYHVIKRAMDLGVSFLILALSFPLWLLIAFLIRLDTRGPVIFIQERIGLDGRPFCMYKFRTLHVNHDSTAHVAYMRSYVNGGSGQTGSGSVVHKPVTASQVTAMGRFLRKTSLDELPQLINVVKGDMSLVGPRPNVPWEVEEYQPWHRRRLEALPGMTGLAQVRGRSCLTFDDIVKYDIEYIEHQNLWLDIKVLLLTPLVVLGGFGAR